MSAWRIRTSVAYADAGPPRLPRPLSGWRRHRRGAALPGPVLLLAGNGRRASAHGRFRSHRLAAVRADVAHHAVAGRARRAVRTAAASLSELAGAGLRRPALDELLWRGGYPALYDRASRRPATGSPATSPPTSSAMSGNCWRCRISLLPAFPAAVRRAHRAIAQSVGAGRRLRHLPTSPRATGSRSGGELSRDPAAALSPQFRQAPGQDTQALFPRYRSGGLAAGDPRRRPRWRCIPCAAPCSRRWSSANSSSSATTPASRPDSTSGATTRA